MYSIILAVLDGMNRI